MAARAGRRPGVRVADTVIIVQGNGEVEGWHARIEAIERLVPPDLGVERGGVNRRYRQAGWVVGPREPVAGTRSGKGHVGCEKNGNRGFHIVDSLRAPSRGGCAWVIRTSHRNVRITI